MATYDGRVEGRGTFVVGSDGNLLSGWWDNQIGLWGRTLAEGWKRDLLEKAGVDFDLDRVRAAMKNSRNATDERMADRASLMAEKRARLLSKLPN